MPKVGGESYLLLAHSREKKLKACPEIIVGSLGLGNLGWTKVTYVVYPHR